MHAEDLERRRDRPHRVETGELGDQLEVEQGLGRGSTESAPDQPEVAMKPLRQEPLTEQGIDLSCVDAEKAKEIVNPHCLGADTAES